MRLTILTMAITGCVLSSAMPSTAQQINPWCLNAQVGKGAVAEMCYYRTFAACSRERINWGTTAFCNVNPHYWFRYGEPRDGVQPLRQSMQ